MNDELEILRSLGISLLIGALIGLEREYHHRLKEASGFAGLRTFMFFALLGSLATWITIKVQPLTLPVAFLGLILLSLTAYFRGSEEQDMGMTTEVAGLLTFLLGCLVAVGEVAVAVALAVVVASLLSAKPIFMRWVKQLTPADIYTTLKFLVVSFVVLPILPNRAYGPFDAFNPYEIWLMVVLIAGVSFLGYVALKLLGPERGVALSGLLGGLASSTAVAMAFSRRSKENPEMARSSALAVLLASTVMTTRVGILSTVVYPPLVRELLIPLTAMGGAGAVASFILWRKTRKTPHNIELAIRNPFSLLSVLTFGVAYAVVLFLVKAFLEVFPNGGTTLVAAVSGLTQVDSITLTAAKMAREALPMQTAVLAILVAALANTASKAVIGMVWGHRAFLRPLLLGLGGMLAAGLVTILVVLFG